MNIAVLGGGNGSYAAAADFTLAGHEVRFWRRDFASFGSLAEKRHCAFWTIMAGMTCTLPRWLPILLMRSAALI